MAPSPFTTTTTVSAKQRLVCVRGCGEAGTLTRCCRLAESQAGLARKSVAAYRAQQAQQSPEQFGKVAGHDLMKKVPRKLNAEQLISAELPMWKLNAVRLKKLAGASAHSSRKFANWLLTSDLGLSETSYPNLRALLRIMIAVPASSVQSVRPTPVTPSAAA